MTKEIKKDGKTFFQCGECKIIYPEKELAEKCEIWCKEHHTCNIEITKYAAGD